MSLLRLYIVESAGETVAYHGTNHNVSRPDPASDAGAMKAMDFGPGMYFTTSVDDARRFGANVYQARLSLNKSLRIEAEPTPEMVRIQKAFRIDDEDLQFADEGWWHGLMGLVVTLIDIGQVTRQKVIAYFRKLGYDSIVVPQDVVRQSRAGRDSNGDYVIVFDASSISDWRHV